MPTFSFVNVSGAMVGLVQGSNNFATVPNGFSGALEAVGELQVFKLGQQVVTTNSLGADLSVVGGGTVWTNANNQRVVGQTYYATNDYVSFKAGGVVIANLNANQDYNLHYTWDGTAVLFLGSENSTEPNLVDITDLTGGAVTTNGDASVLLGTFNADTTLRCVQVQADVIQVTTFADAFGWVGTGFMLGMTIHVFRWILRLARAIPSQGGDF